MVDPPPQIVSFAIDLDEHFTKMPAPLPISSRLFHPLAPDVGGEHRPKPVPPVPNSLVADVDLGFEQQFFDIKQTQRKPYMQNHHQANCLR